MLEGGYVYRISRGGGIGLARPTIKPGEKRFPLKLDFIF